MKDTLLLSRSITYARASRLIDPVWTGLLGNPVLLDLLLVNLVLVLLDPIR